MLRNALHRAAHLVSSALAGTALNSGAHPMGYCTAHSSTPQGLQQLLLPALPSAGYTQQVRHSHFATPIHGTSTLLMPAFSCGAA